MVGEEVLNVVDIVEGEEAEGGGRCGGRCGF